jgi:TonB family protein
VWRVRRAAIATIALLFLSGVLFAQEPGATEASDVPPKLLKQKKPKYPKEAFRNRLEGVVLVEFVVDEKGRVAKATVTESVPGLDQAAVDAVLRWRFQPAQKNGKPVRAIALAPVSFCIVEPGCGAMRLPQQEK